MANTYSQIHIQLVFAVSSRTYLIRESWKDELCMYMTGIIQSYGHKVLAINAMPDHIHVLFGMRPTQAVSELVREIKTGSAKWINGSGFLKGRFEWQEGYGAFSYEKGSLPGIISYIAIQKEHHHIKTFMEEYREMLYEFGVQFDERFLFREPS